LGRRSRVVSSMLSGLADCPRCLVNFEDDPRAQHQALLAETRARMQQLRISLTNMPEIRRSTEPALAELRALRQAC
jgi:hypothetical protein